MRKRGEVEPIEKRPHVKPRSSDDERHMAALANLRERSSRISLVAEDVVTLARVGHVDEVMSYVRAVLRRRLRRADVHRAVDLTRVGRDDLGAEALRDAHGERALSGGGRTDDRDHVRTAASTARSASRARSTVPSSGASSP